MEEVTEKISGKDSWILESSAVRLAVSKLGGHMAPVTFYRSDESSISPYYISPWQEERLKVDVDVLKPLRGDFFCMPFGGDNESERESHPAHGETATKNWTFSSVSENDNSRTLELALSTKVRQGSVSKKLSLIEGHNVVYSTHTISGFSGKTPLGHHATLAASEEEPFVISTSPIKYGLVAPSSSEYSVDGEYHALKEGAKFSTLKKVPTKWKDQQLSDCTIFPNRFGFCDIIQVYSKGKKEPAWTTAVSQQKGYMWFSIKDPAILNSTLFWMENYGRHSSPWKGRNCCIGIEDVCAYFAEGLGQSIGKNPVNKDGISTSIKLKDGTDFSVNYIQGVVKIPVNYKKTSTVEFKKNRVVFTSKSGIAVEAPVHWKFVYDGSLHE